MTDVATVAIDLAELAGRAGTPLGRGPWHRVTQEQVDLFADATGDHQWIHIDPIRARSGPFGRTIVHGYLTLSLAPQLLFEVVRVDGAALVVNYGANKVRFPAPLPVGARVRLAVDCEAVDVFEGGAQAAFRLTFEVEDQPKPCCVAEILFRYYA